MAIAAWCMTPDKLRDLAAAVLAGAKTIAGDTVYGPDTLPTGTDKLPALVVSAPSERKESSGEGAPQFAATIALAILARVSGKGAAGEADAERELGQLLNQVERALFCTPAMVNAVERFDYVESHRVVSAQGSTFIGEASMIIGCRVRQLYEPDGGEPFTEADVHTREPPGSGPGFRSFLTP